MIRGLYTSASGMLAKQQQMNVVANNLANVNTAGYKRDQTVFREFPKYWQHRLNDDVMLTTKGLIDFAPPVGKLGTGVTVDAIFTQFEQGSLARTDNKFDLGLFGDGFLAVQTETGVKYTRAGNFTLNADGELVTMRGHNLLDENNQPIKTGFNDFAVTPDGSVYIKNTASNERLTKVQVVKFEDNRGLRKVGENFYVPTEHSGEPTSASGKDVVINQGYTERANLNIVTEMVRMIEVQRAYEANSKVLKTHDTLAGKAVNDLMRM